MGKLRRWILRLMLYPHRRHSHDSLLSDSDISKLYCHVGPKQSPSQSRIPHLPRGLHSRSWSQMPRRMTEDEVALGRSRSTNSWTPRGHVAVYVGDERERFLLPISYLSHPHMEGLLRKAEREFGFEQRGGLRIPCAVSELQHAIALIQAESLEQQCSQSPCISLPTSPSWTRTRSLDKFAL